MKPSFFTIIFVSRRLLARYSRSLRRAKGTKSGCTGILRPHVYGRQTTAKEVQLLSAAPGGVSPSTYATTPYARTRTHTSTTTTAAMLEAGAKQGRLHGSSRSRAVLT